MEIVTVFLSFSSEWKFDFRWWTAWLECLLSLPLHHCLLFLHSHIQDPMLFWACYVILTPRNTLNYGMRFMEYQEFSVCNLPYP